jgi:myo-inositol 2-dehydrogenase/D-chiro-inositol 1-dehydrogenase
VRASVNSEESDLSRDFTAVFEFPNGGYGMISQTLGGFEHHQVVEVTGTGGAIRSLWSGAMDRTDKPQYSVAYKTRSEEHPHYLNLEGPSGELFEIRRYIGSALDEMEAGVSVYPVEKELQLMRVCLAAEQSARTGTRVEL